MWGAGIRVGGLVRRVNGAAGESEAQLGWVRGWNRVGAEAGVWVDWGEREWCCASGTSCGDCAPLLGHGKCWVGAFQRHKSEHDWTDPRDIARMWGGEPKAPAEDEPSRLVVWTAPRGEGGGYRGAAPLSCGGGQATVDSPRHDEGGR